MLRRKALLEKLKKFRKGSKVPGLTGVSILADRVVIARVENNDGDMPRVMSYDELMIPASGDERDKSLAALAADKNLKNARCTTVLNPGEYSLLITEAPDVPAEELKAAVRWRIKDLIDFHIDDATLDVFDIPGEETANRARSMYTVAARNDAIRSRAQWVQNPGIGLEIIDIAELVQRNLANLIPDSEAGIVMVTLFPQSGLITITRGGELYLSRNLDVGSDALTEGSDPEAYFDRIVLEVQRSLDYYDSHFRQAPIRQLILAPPADETPGLLDFLDSRLDLQASAMDLGQLLDWHVAIPDRIDSTALLTLGAALRKEERVL